MQRNASFRQFTQSRALCTLLRLHIRAQWLMYLLPPAFLYLLLLPSQLSLLAAGPLTDEILRQIRVLTIEFLLPFGVWYQFLAFRIIRFAPARECVRACLSRRRLLLWSLANLALYLLVTAPYLLRLELAIRQASK